MKLFYPRILPRLKVAGVTESVTNCTHNGLGEAGARARTGDLLITNRRGLALNLCRSLRLRARGPADLFRIFACAAKKRNGILPQRFTPRNKYLLMSSASLIGGAR
jgi:hypothetical protein